MKAGDKTCNRHRRGRPCQGLCRNGHRHSSLGDVVEDIPVEIVDLEGADDAGDEREEGPLPQRLGAPGNRLCHLDDIEGSLQRIDPSHQVLGAVQDRGVETIDIHLLRRKIIRIDRKDHEMDVLQGVTQPGNIPDILQEGLTFLIRFKVDHIEDRSTRSKIDILSLTIEIVLLLPAAEDHLLRRPGNRILDHGPR